MIEDVVTMYRYDQRGCGRSQDCGSYDAIEDSCSGVGSRANVNAWMVGFASFIPDIEQVYRTRIGNGVLQIWTVDDLHHLKSTKAAAVDNPFSLHLEWCVRLDVSARLPS